jgi:PhnB protein
MPQNFVRPYLFFPGNCEEAIEFYRTAIGAEVEMTMRFSESPDPHPPGMIPPGAENKIMHTSFRVGDSVIMASDGAICGGHPVKGFEGFSLSIGVATEAEADQLFNALSAGGKVNMPLAKTFWSPRFGMLTDKFGIDWMISVTPSK